MGALIFRPTYDTVLRIISRGKFFGEKLAGACIYSMRTVGEGWVITNLVLDVAFFMSAGRVAEGDLKASRIRLTKNTS